MAPYRTFIIRSTFSQHSSLFTPLFQSRTSKFTTTTALPFYICKLHFTTAEIVISTFSALGLRNIVHIMSTSKKIIYLESGRNQDEDLLQPHCGISRKKLKIFAWQVYRLAIGISLEKGKVGKHFF